MKKLLILLLFLALTLTRVADAATTACGNGNPDIGAVETLGAPTATVDGTAFTITVPNNCTSGMLPTTGVTGFTFKKNGAGNTVLTNILGGSSTYTGTLTNAFVGGGTPDTCLFSYAQTGNATSNNNIGNVATSNQEILAFTDVACTNITGGGGGSVGLSDYQIFLAQGANPTLWTAKCLVNTPCTVAPGSLVWVVLNLRNNSGSNFAAFNYALRLSFNSGAYVTFNDAAYTNNLKLAGNAAQLGTVIENAAAMPANLIANRESTDVIGQAIRASGSFPSLTMNNATETNLATLVKFSTDAAGNYKFCPYTDPGTALTCTTPAEINLPSSTTSTGSAD